MVENGSIIGNKYEILKLIGQGGMSKVYLAADKKSNRIWAIKEISKDSNNTNNEIAIQGAIAEATLIKQLDHPTIVHIVDIIETDDAIYIIEDYVEGKSLRAILLEKGAQPQELVIKWALKLCDALDYLHSHNPPIIYRDMKPGNIMLTSSEDIKIIDFGIAREFKENSIADTSALGTIGYAAPEQYGGKGQTDFRTDIYGLGVTLYHLITGHDPSEPPYELYPIRHWNPHLSSNLEIVIKKCTQSNPNNRYQSCNELMQALLNCNNYCTTYKQKTPFVFIKFLFENGISSIRKKKYINEESQKDTKEQISTDSAKYMAKILANIQKDEKSGTTIKGPDYNE